MNLSIKEAALIGLAGMYNEWRGQDRKVIEWSVKLHEFYKKLKNPNKTLFTLYILSSQYATIGDTVKPVITLRKQRNCGIQ
ncbi:MAG: hypothetical protein IPP39_05310 [Chitinophagaceae bacterium]|nr:hypothetical protein [Chitinophagaceae bacterium]